MKIGLVRHFKVIKEFPKHKLFTPEDVTKWFQEYDEADVEIAAVDTKEIEWTSCFSSDLPRAITTAQTIYKGNIVTTAQLREIPVPYFKGKLKLPFILWAILSRTVMRFTKEAKDDWKEGEQRVQLFLDEILPKEEDALIVSHALIMSIMEKELVKRGFVGPTFKIPENGVVYVFEKTEME